jgi:predicted aspartyl protease
MSTSSLRRLKPHLLTRLIIYIAILGALPLLGKFQLRSEEASNRSFRDLAQMVRRKHYIEFARELDRAHGLSVSEFVFFSGILANRKNKVSESIRLLEPLAQTLIHGPIEYAELGLCALADDYAKSFRYGDAADTYIMLANMPGYTEEDSACHAISEADRWSLLRRAPPQKTTVSSAFTVEEIHTSAGLLEVNVRAPNFSDHWILDTGANLSAVTRTVAERLGLTLSTATSTAQGSGGVFVRIHTAVIPELHICRATIRNLAVLVFDDIDLSFPELSYQIHGSLGFPALQSLGIVTFHNDGRFTVHDAVSHGKARPTELYLEGFTILLEATIAGNDHLFTLDTGASGTYLSHEYYQEHRNTFDTAPLRELELIGAGGSRIIHIHVLNDVNITLGGASAELHDVAVLTEPTGLPAEFSGNLGQSTLGMLSDYTIDFRNMTFSVHVRSNAARSKPATKLAKGGICCT